MIVPPSFSGTFCTDLETSLASYVVRVGGTEGHQIHGIEQASSTLSGLVCRWDFGTQLTGYPISRIFHVCGFVPVASRQKYRREAILAESGGV
jgi:hypothetical protein